MNYAHESGSIGAAVTHTKEPVDGGRRSCWNHQVTVISPDVGGTITIEAKTGKDAEWEQVGNVIDLATPGRSIAFNAYIYALRAVPAGLVSPYQVEFIGGENS